MPRFAFVAVPFLALMAQPASAGPCGDRVRIQAIEIQYSGNSALIYANLANVSPAGLRLAVNMRGVGIAGVVVNAVPATYVPGREARRWQIARGPGSLRLDDAAFRNAIMLDCT